MCLLCNTHSHSQSHRYAAAIHTPAHRPHQPSLTHPLACMAAVTSVCACAMLHWAAAHASVIAGLLSSPRFQPHMHVLHVLCAGEFCIVPDSTAAGGHRLVIDNNSGTYAPPAEALPCIAALLKVGAPCTYSHSPPKRFPPRMRPSIPPPFHMH